MSHEFLFWICAVTLLVLVAIAAFLPLWKNGKKDKAVCAGLTFMFLCAALYLYLGNPFMIDVIASERQLWAEKIERIELLEAKATKEGLLAEEWAELGQIQSSAENYQAAAEAFKQAAIASEGNAEYILQFGKNLMFAADGEVTEEARGAFAMAASLIPHPEAEFYLAVYDIQQGNGEAAKVRLQRLMDILPQGIPLRGIIEKQLNLIEQGKI